MQIKKNECTVSIVLDDDCEDASYVDGFIDIWTDEGNLPSPFKDIESAEIFANIIVKLLGTVHDFDEVKE